MNLIVFAWLALSAYGVWVTAHEWRQAAKDRRALVLRVESDDVDLLLWTGLQVRLSAGRLVVQLLFLAAGLIVVESWPLPWPWLLLVAQVVAVWLAHESRRVRRMQYRRKRKRRT